MMILYSFTLYIPLWAQFETLLYSFLYNTQDKTLTTLALNYILSIKLMHPILF